MTVFTEWNSSPIVKRTTKQAKVRELLTPMSFSLIHAADFASRVHAQILPALRAGRLSWPTGMFIRRRADAVRGVNRDWVRRIYSSRFSPHWACISGCRLRFRLSGSAPGGNSSILRGGPGYGILQTIARNRFASSRPSFSTNTKV